ncbi:MAG: Fe-S cluster assembly ATPase SufC [Opitutales bacterium]
MNTGLYLENLKVNLGDKVLIDNLNLHVPNGEIHVIMGKNGTGKSTLSKALSGHSDYQITGGKALLNGENIVGEAVEDISRKGLFLAFQHPVEVEGVTIANFIRACINARLPEGIDINVPEFYKELREKMAQLDMPSTMSARNLNEGFSGGEKKRCDILQMLMLKPNFVILDEPDSGLDVDALKIVSQGINSYKSKDVGFLVITHYHRLLEYIKPDVVHILDGGKIVKSGTAQLAKDLEELGYDGVVKA